MKVSSALYLFTLLPLATPLTLPTLNLRDALPVPELISHSTASELDTRNNDVAVLEKRRGGGGGGGGGRGGGSGGSSGGSSSSGSSSGGGSSGGARSGGSSAPSSSGFSSSTPSYAGGRSFAGGSSTPYSAGRRTPRGIVPAFLAVGAITFFGAAWLYGGFSYPYTHRYPYQNQSLPVVCYCQQYSACGCEDTDNTTTISEVLKNDTVAKIETVNGTKTVVIDGTLPNGTDPSFDAGDTSAAPGFKQLAKEASGFWLLGAVVGLMIWGL